jgi:diguanylate cyclase (GGDEF)-like protein/PAS domain S-box-containing protein
LAESFHMRFSYTPYLLPFFLAFGLVGFVLLRSWRFRNKPLGRVFLHMLIALQIWTFGFILEIAATELDAKLFWANIQFLGILPLPLFWLEISLRFTGYAKNIRKYIRALALPVLLVLLSIWTNDYHHLFRREPYLDCASAPFCVLVNDYGAAFYADAVFSYLLFLFSLALMITSLVMTKPVYRQQLLMILISLSAPLMVDILYVMGISPIPHFNFTTVTFSISSVFVSVALFRYRLFSIRPMAYDLIIENLNDGIIIADDKDIIVDINPAARKFLTTEYEGVIGAPVDTFLDQWLGKKGSLLHLTKSRSVNDIEHNGRTYCFDVDISSIADRSGYQVGRAVIIRDITEQVKLNREVEQLAVTDSLTGLWNRRHFFHLGERALLHALRYQSYLSLLMIDLDHFKKVNDTYGHTIGDEVLREFARFLKGCVRNADIVARYGGEEFVVLLPEVKKVAAFETAERIRKELARTPLKVDDLEVLITTSIGVSEFIRAEDEVLEQVIKRADVALYAAKKAGRNQVSG